MKNKAKFTADLGKYILYREAGFSAKKAEIIAEDLFRIEIMKSEVRELSDKVDSLAKRFDGQLREVISKMGEMPTRAEVKASEDRLLQVISWRLVVFMAVFTVMGAGLFALMGGLFAS